MKKEKGIYKITINSNKDCWNENVLEINGKIVHAHSINFQLDGESPAKLSYEIYEPKEIELIESQVIIKL